MSITSTRSSVYKIYKYTQYRFANTFLPRLHFGHPISSLDYDALLHLGFAQRLALPAAQPFPNEQKTSRKTSKFF